MYSKCYKLDDIKRVFKIECFQKDPQTFEKTHYFLSFNFKDPQFREVSMMEAALVEGQWRMGLEERRKTGDYIRPYVIWGASGTGKTELCRWLELNIPSMHSDYETRRITKRELAMGGILGVAQVLSGSDIDFAERLLSRHGDVGVEDVSVWAMGNLVKQSKIIIEAENKDEVLRMFKTHIRKNIVERVKLIECAEDISKVETTLQFITPADLEVLSYYGVKLDIGKINREIYRALTPFIANVDDVKRLIFDFIRKKNESGKIPVFIFDDVTHLGDLVDDFITVVTDISGGEEGYVCDFVIGTTTEFYISKFKDALASTARARIFEVKLSPEEREDMMHANWLLGKDGLAHFLDFVLRYLDAARSCGGCSNCKKTSFVEEGYNYHPFTKAFLINFYNRILREKEEPARKGITVSVTPRFIIQVLRSTLTNFVEKSQPPSSFMDDSLILNTVDFFKLKQEEKEELKEFLRAVWWYGSHSEDGTRVVLDMETLKQLDLAVLIPSHFKDKVEVEFEVIPLRRLLREEITEEGMAVSPKPVDDVSLMANIRGWCKDESSQIALNPIVEGFNEVTRQLTESLPGSNNFRNIMNYKSSREGETIEFSPPGKKECPFWIGELKDDELQLYIMSKYKEAPLKPYVEKGFLVLHLNEDDFFRLHKIGARSTPEIERSKYFREFLDSKYDDVYEALWRQRLRLRSRLEKQLGYSAECFVLSVYLLANKILKSKVALGELKEADDIITLMSQEIDMKGDAWPVDMRNLVERLKASFSTIENLFHSFFSLRGEGSIVDYLVLEDAWSKVKPDVWKKILKDAGKVDERFILPKSKMKLNEFVHLIKGLLNKIEAYSQNYNKNDINKKIQELELLIAQLGDTNNLINFLKSLSVKLKEEFKSQSIQLNSIMIDLENVESLNEIREQLDLIQLRVNNVKDAVDKAVVMAALQNLERLKIVRIAVSLDAILDSIESRISSILESDLTRLKEEYLRYLKVDKVL